MLIRNMQSEELSTLVRIYVDTLKATHTEIVSERFLEILSYEVALQRLEGILKKKVLHPFCYVAEENGTLTGFVLGALAENPPAGYQGEVKTIYILPAYHRRGIGRDLIRTAAEHFAREQVPSMFLGVFADNYPARRFYASLGGRVIKEYADEIRGEKCTIALYGWPSVHALIQTHPSYPG
jgi:ribosomal protein S18 acetylase RimI-like enzyme